MLELGYRVRGTARAHKVKALQETVKVPGLEFAAIDDVATSDFTEALKGKRRSSTPLSREFISLTGVHAVFHVAAPLPGKASADDTIKVFRPGLSM